MFTILRFFTKSHQRPRAMADSEAANSLIRTNCRPRSQLKIALPRFLAEIVKNCLRETPVVERRVETGLNTLSIGNVVIAI